PAGFTSISGSTTSGVANLAVPIGTGDWLDLTRIVFHSEGNGFGFGSAPTANKSNKKGRSVSGLFCGVSYSVFQQETTQLIAAGRVPEL
ncbi:MAG: hypothetical protein QF790_00520, partial [Gammaproteobacteria bacterium]|nr:hypothetical protein [Gammaproteobacteria bacterium]